MRAVEDLSVQHELISDLFPRLDAKEAWEKFKLSDEQVSFFHTYGFLAGVKLLDNAQVVHLRD